MLEQQEAAVVHHIGDHFRAQPDRLLHVVDEREQALALDAHGMLAGGGIDRRIPQAGGEAP
jgi:hypothetical protein